MIDLNKINPTTRIALGACLLLATMPACTDSGGRARTAGATISPATTLDVDFGLRRDLRLSMGAFLGDVVHRDLNGDGIEDLIETNFLGQRLVIALGLPNGTFTTIVERNTLGKAFRLALGDFDGNGLQDIAVANRERQGVGIQCVEVFLQRAELDFSGSTLVYFSESDPTDLAVGANPRIGVGEGGVDEIFAAFQESREIHVLDASSGTELESVEILTSDSLGSGQPFSLAFIENNFFFDYDDEEDGFGGDFGGLLFVGETRIAGQPDRVIVYPRFGGDILTRSSREGEFGPPSVVLSPVYKPVVDNVGDVDGNESEDIAVAQLEASEIFLIPLNGDGFDPISIDFGARTTSVIFPDLDGDGYAEAVATTLNQASVQVRQGTGPMSWGDSVHYNVGPVPRAIDTILLPGDSIPDILCANITDLTVMVGLGDGSFRAARGYDTGLARPGSLLLADLTGNGVLDYVATSAFQRTITFHEGAGDGSFSLGSELPMSASSSERPSGLGVADVDNDGDLDVLASVGSANQVRLYRNNGSVAGFVDALPADITMVGSNPSGIAIGNFNNDAFPDIAVANTDDQTIQLLFNDGSGNFAPQPAVATQLLQPSGLRCADFDSDGSMDLAVTGATSIGFEVRIFRGNAAMGTMTFVGSYVLDDLANSMALGDFNSDGELDLVIGQTSFASSDIFVLLNLDDGALGFQSNRIAMGTLGPANVMVEDLDNDSNLDILVASAEGELRMLLGDGLGGFGTPLPGRGELPNIVNCFSASLVDVNGDALSDVITVSKESPFMWVGLNTSVSSSIP